MKKELIEKIMSMTHPTQDLAYIGKGFLQQILEEELPDFQRIDEERFKELFIEHYGNISWDNSYTLKLIRKYNSTLPSASNLEIIRITTPLLMMYFLLPYSYTGLKL